LLKADLHLHTTYSFDCATRPEQVVAHCLKIGISCIAVTDHNTIEGALKLKDIAPFHVIVGEEILTPSGEILGLFLQERIPRGLPAEEVIARIRKQGGLVCMPHPFARLARAAFDPQTLEAILPQIDIIEAFNSRSLLLRSSTQASKFAQSHGLPASAGSDAHTPGEIGNAYVEMPEFNSPPEFLRALAQGRVFGHRTNPLVHVLGTIKSLRKRF
jgi:predicted metal-dependent phosphoesterase TrpH